MKEPPKMDSLLFRKLIKSICFLFSQNVLNYKAVWI